MTEPARVDVEELAREALKCDWTCDVSHGDEVDDGVYGAPVEVVNRWVARASLREPALAREVLRLRAWLVARRDGLLGDNDEGQAEAGWTPWPVAALRGDPAP